VPPPPQQQQQQQQPAAPVPPPQPQLPAPAPKPYIASQQAYVNAFVSPLFVSAREQAHERVLEEAPWLRSADEQALTLAPGVRANYAELVASFALQALYTSGNNTRHAADYGVYVARIREAANKFRRVQLSALDGVRLHAAPPLVQANLTYPYGPSLSTDAIGGIAGLQTPPLYPSGSIYNFGAASASAAATTTPLPSAAPWLAVKHSGTVINALADMRRPPAPAASSYANALDAVARRLSAATATASTTTPSSMLQRNRIHSYWSSPP
jgi:hypothetical protein